MTKFLTKAALATLATGLFAAPVLAANTVTAPFTAKAVIVKPLTLVNTGDLDFGTITMGAALTSSAVVVGRTGGAAASSCGANLTCSAPAAATFDVTGVALQQLNITVASLPASLVHTTDATKSVPFSADADPSVTLDASGLGSFDIGGSITVSSTTADGTYDADVDVTVEYN